MQELAEHRAYRDEQDRAIEACRVRTAELKAKLAEEGDQVTAEGREYYVTQLMKMTQASARMQKEKEEAEALFEKTREEKQMVEESLKEVKRISDLMNNQIAEMEAVMDKPLDDTKSEYSKEIIDNIETHLHIKNLAIKCSQCNRKFDNQRDTSATACIRVILPECNCVEFCADCVRRFRPQRCPIHNTPIGTPIPYVFHG